ncbi:NAD-dependent epimerase/dehydratase family protein [Roseimarinus sediminis]|uniref:NAD-dependent epimerase/dehydratase family protein n=1 Tax=Roseimarinus sediminis TaxID=1610899 RepID=UPI003D1F2025
MNKKVVVFGGGGFIGGYVVNELQKRNYNVIVADLSEPRYLQSAQFERCDILDAKKVNEIIGKGVDYVYNFAGFANLEDANNNPHLTFQLNVLGNLNILQACANNNIQRFIYASSAYAMSSKGSFYGISKLTSEKIIEEFQIKYHLAYSIIRYGSLYSEQNHHNNYIYNLIKEAISTHSINHKGNGEEYREYIHAADAASLSVDILESEKFVNQHLILTGLEKMQRIELFKMIAEIMNIELNIKLNTSAEHDHYEITPYSFHPTSSKKLIANPYIDLGQGLLECIKNISNEINLNDK